MIWVGIALCLSQSALFSGLTIGFFGLSRLRLEVQAEAGNQDAAKVLSIRKDSNFLLATLLWGNVGVNVLLTMLSESVLAGFGAFIFSTVGITLFGEIVPQAFLSRHGLQAGAMLIPFVKTYEILLFPVAKPTAFLLDLWLGKEGIVFFREREVNVILQKHAMSSYSDIGKMEAIGASNFLALDDILVEKEGELVNPLSIVALPTDSGSVVFPKFRNNPQDPFLKKIQLSKKKWVVITDLSGQPLLILNVNRFLRNFLCEENINSNPHAFCHRPILVTRQGTHLGEVIQKLRVEAESPEDDVVDDDTILYWNSEKRIITGADILGRLLRGIVCSNRNQNDTRGFNSQI